MAQIKFRFNSPKKAEESTAPYGIIADVMIDERIKINTGIKIKFKHFNPDYENNLTKIVRPTIQQDGIHRATKIEEFKMVAEKIALGIQLYYKGEFNSFPSAKEALEHYLQKGSLAQGNIVEKYQEFENYKSGEALEKRTKSNYQRVGAAILEIVTDNPDKVFDVFNLDHEFFQAFHTYAVKRDFVSSTYNKYLKTIKIFMKWVDETYRDKRISLYYKKVNYLPEPKPEEHAFFLEEHEVRTLCSFNYGTEGKNREAMIFLFQYAIGARDSDIRPLSKSLNYILEDQKRLIITNKKGKKVLDLTLPEIAMHVYRKFKDMGKLPMSSNQKRNDILKEMVIKAKMDRMIPVKEFRVKNNTFETEYKMMSQLITTHWARASFLTNMNARNITHGILAMVTGQDSRTIKGYQKVDDTAIKKNVHPILNEVFHSLLAQQLPKEE